MAGTAAQRDQGRLHIRVASLCFMVLFLEGYDITSMSYAIPSMIDAWHVKPPQFTDRADRRQFWPAVRRVSSAGLLGDRLGRKPVLIGCTAVFGVFSLLTAFAHWIAARSRCCGSSPGLGLGGGIPIAIALATDYAPLLSSPRRLVILMSAGISVGNTMQAASSPRRSSNTTGWQAIFVVGGLLPILVIPLLILFMPESHAHCGRSRFGGSQDDASWICSATDWRCAPSILWMVNLFNLVGNYFILFWLPAILHAKGLTPSAAILATTMYALGSILCALITAPIVDRFGVERIIASILCLGAACVLTVGLFELPFPLLCVVICGAGIGIGGCQHGINSVSGALYPPEMRATGAGWALGLGRVGQIGGPLVGGYHARAGMGVAGHFPGGVDPRGVRRTRYGHSGMAAHPA